MMGGNEIEKREKKQALYFTASELAKRGKENIPDELISGTHLIYSSPATLAFNSPGAEGFGVKRAGLAVPGSVMLIVSPGCCGRNTSMISDMPQYHDRFFYLTMDETDVVTGRHLKKIPGAVKEIVGHLEDLGKKPEVVMICITCVDALLGTDMERVCRKAEEEVDVPVRPCYMYALTREGRKPPMVHVRQSIYSLLEASRKKSNVVDILGFFAPLMDSCELYELLHQIGIRTIHEISRCENLSEYKKMSEANFALVLNPEARAAAEDFERKLKIPSIELKRFYDIDRIQRQYKALGSALGVEFQDEKFRETARESIEAVIRKLEEAKKNLHFYIGECLNADSFELALALVKMGFLVDEIYGTLTADNFIYLKQLSVLSPKTRVYSNLHPSMLYYEEKDGALEQTDVINIALGKDAAYYHPKAICIHWNSDCQPYGYDGVKSLMEEILEKICRNLEGEEGHTDINKVVCEDRNPAGKNYSQDQGDFIHAAEGSKTNYIRGLQKYLTPFAPDQSGAVSVLYELGGILVICDAGGCVGNICGFDEPRWQGKKSAVFSAGLRDMDAIMGRDELLVRKLQKAAEDVDASFVALIGTPVPSVIGTDYHALIKMAERKLKIPVLAIDTNGMEYYDRGASKAYLELISYVLKKKKNDVEAGANPKTKGRTGILGCNPLDMSDTSAAKKLKDYFRQQNMGEPFIWGIDRAGEDEDILSELSENLVIAPSGLAAARLLEKKYDIPFKVMDPLGAGFAGEILKEYAEALQKAQNILIIDQQVAANSIRLTLEAELEKDKARIRTASWFMMDKELTREGDLHISGEKAFEDLVQNESFDMIVGDPILKRMLSNFDGLFIDKAQFALSGKLN